MNTISKIASLIALAVTVIPSLVYFMGALDSEPMKWVALAGTIAWFIATPLWMGREPRIDATEVEI